MATPQDVRKKGIKILKLSSFAIVYISSDKWIGCIINSLKIPKLKKITTRN